MQLTAPRGTYDILPYDIAKWRLVEKIARDTAELFGYHEVRTPIFEHTELFKRGVGETTDVVMKEMYTFLDRADRSLTLRPEATASCVRCLLEHNCHNGLLPVKWFYSGPMFRYDRPQAGRHRQFHQFGIEAFGSNSPYLDVEVIILMTRIVIKLGLTEYELHINSIGCHHCRADYRQKLVEVIKPVRDRLCSDCRMRYAQNPLRVLDCKNQSCHKMLNNIPRIEEFLCQDCIDHYNQVLTGLHQSGINYIRDDKLVRGLDYYTNTAFEIHLPGIGAQSAVGGGGRYNGLVKACGGPDLPGIGFALGIERLILGIDRLANNLPADNKVKVLVVVMNEELEPEAMQVLNRLRRANISADKDYIGRSGKAQMKYADKLGVRIAVIVGEEEVKNHFLTIRNMDTKEQLQVPYDALTETIKGILSE
jgi:histidyl-tRNA synthetase